MIYIVEGTFKGKDQRTLADELNVDERTIRRELVKATNEGVVERVRERMLTTLEGVPDVYDAILKATPEELHKLSRGFKLKLDAANALSTGTAVFRPEKVNRQEWTLEAIASEQPKPREGLYGDRERRRLAFKAAADAGIEDGELIPPDSEAYALLSAPESDDS